MTAASVSSEVSRPQSRPQVMAVAGVQTEKPQAICCQPASVARTAERLRRRRDDAERLAVACDIAIGGCPAVSRERRRAPSRLGDPLEDLALRDDEVGRPASRTAHVHVLDEAHFRADLPPVVQQRAHFIVIHAFHEHRVDLDDGKVASGGGDAVQHRVERIEARELLKAASGRVYRG